MTQIVFLKGVNSKIIANCILICTIFYFSGSMANTPSTCRSVLVSEIDSKINTRVGKIVRDHYLKDGLRSYDFRDVRKSLIEKGISNIEVEQIISIMVLQELYDTGFIYLTFADAFSKHYGISKKTISSIHYFKTSIDPKFIDETGATHMTCNWLQQTKLAINSHYPWPLIFASS